MIRFSFNNYKSNRTPLIIQDDAHRFSIEECRDEIFTELRLLGSTINPLNITTRIYRIVALARYLCSLLNNCTEPDDIIDIIVRDGKKIEIVPPKFEDYNFLDEPGVFLVPDQKEETSYFKRLN